MPLALSNDGRAMKTGTLALTNTGGAVCCCGGVGPPPGVPCEWCDCGVLGKGVCAQAPLSCQGPDPTSLCQYEAIFHSSLNAHVSVFDDFIKATPFGPTSANLDHDLAKSSGVVTQPRNNPPCGASGSLQADTVYTPPRPTPGVIVEPYPVYILDSNTSFGVDPCPIERLDDPFTHSAAWPILPGGLGQIFQGPASFQAVRHLVRAKVFAKVNRALYDTHTPVPASATGPTDIQIDVAHDILSGDTIWKIRYGSASGPSFNWLGEQSGQVVAIPNDGKCPHTMHIAANVSWDTGAAGSPPYSTSGYAFSNGDWNLNALLSIPALQACEDESGECVGCNGLERGVPL